MQTLELGVWATSPTDLGAGYLSYQPRRQWSWVFELPGTQASELGICVVSHADLGAGYLCYQEEERDNAACSHTYTSCV